ncbi:NIPSNAP family protein [Algoriphagus algorifonticola]|uniref:NIPSNAP family protein n=1 Tax=Algoriphagus algorifonticola TaxID=2593007 RepID=UPI0011A013B5|nr:NIPSNAP family protein [Algoriphagus algorifonticola]
MKKLFTVILLAFLSVQVFGQQLQNIKSNYFELRVYTAHEGKMPDLINRFQNHTMKIFERLGMENIAYFLPVDESENKLYYILGYPDAKSRDLLWQKFSADEEWQAAYQESIKDGILVKDIQETFMVFAPGLNEGPLPAPSGIFQLRIYHCFDGKISDIQSRFRNHTQALFEKQGLKNYPYFLTVEKGGNQPKLIYLLGHSNQATYEKSFADFVKDPVWIKVKEASEKDGKIVERVDAVFLKTLPFSPMK